MPKLWFITLMGHQYMISPYLLFNGIGLAIGLLYLDTQLKKKIPDISDKAYILFVFSIIFGWIGAYIFNWAVEGKTFSNSGFTFYGGLLSGFFFYAIAGYFYLGKEMIPQALNSAVVPFIFAHAIGRIGCFFSGCCHGIVLPNGHFLSPIFDIHPTQLYEASFLLMLAVFIFFIEKKCPKRIIYIYFAAYGVFRFFVEYLRGDSRMFFYGLSSAQWLSLMILLGITIMVLTEKKNFIARLTQKLLLSNFKGADNA